MVALRALPVAPFTLVNLAAGAGAIRLSDFILGTLIGMAPGLELIAVLGDRLRLLADHSACEIALWPSALRCGSAFRSVRRRCFPAVRRDP